MPDRTSPEELRMTPRMLTLPAGTELWRCHRTRYAATEFNPVAIRSPFRGSRFDSTHEDPYPFLYAAREPATALAEVLLRSLDFSGPASERQVSRAKANGYSLSRLRSTVDLTLIRLVTEEDLAAVCQDSWLLEAEDAAATQTRYWAKEMRRQATAAQGLLWQSRRHRPREALVLFEDRCGDQPVKAEPGISYDLATEAGTAEANRLLHPLRSVLGPVRPVSVG